MYMAISIKPSVIGSLGSHKVLYASHILSNLTYTRDILLQVKATFAVLCLSRLRNNIRRL